MRQVDTIDVEGCNGDFCRISDRDLTWGPLLAPGSTGLFDMPIQTNWGSYGYGQFYQSWKPKRRDVIWTIHLMCPDTGDRLSQDSYLWHLICSRWKAMFHPDKESKIIYTSVDGERIMRVRPLDTSKSFSTQNWEGIDPHIFSYGSLVQAMAAELPFYVGKPDIYPFEFATPGDSWLTLPYFNPGTVDIWPEWELTYGAQYVLPDYSYYNEIHGRGIADLGKTVLTPEIMPGDGSVTVFTRPDLETYVSEWDTMVGGRAGGRDFEYPIRPGSGSSDPAEGCVVRAIGVGDDGAAGILTLPRWYDSPFSTPLVV